MNEWVGIVPQLGKKHHRLLKLSRLRFPGIRSPPQSLKQPIPVTPYRYSSSSLISWVFFPQYSLPVHQCWYPWTEFIPQTLKLLFRGKEQNIWSLGTGLPREREERKRYSFSCPLPHPKSSQLSHSSPIPNLIPTSGESPEELHRWLSSHVKGNISDGE